jgi:putative cell wall-binding protein
VRTLGARKGSTPRLTFRRRLAAGAALCIATTTAAVVGASVPALADVSTATVTPSRTAAGATSNYTIVFTTTAVVAGGGTVTLVQAGGTTFPMITADYTVDGTTVTAVTATTNGVILTLASPGAPIGTTTVVASALKNPPAPVLTTLTVATSAETNPVTSAAYNITTATPVSGVVVSTVFPSKASSTTAQYTIQFAVTTLLNPNSDTITLTGPTGTVFPLITGDYFITAGGTQALENFTPTQTVANNVTLNVPPGSTGAGTPLFVHAFNVTNPSTSGAKILSVSTSADTAAGTSASYTITPATAVSVVSVTPARLAAGAVTTYSAAFVATTALATPDTITITATNTSTVFPLGASNYTVADNLAPGVAVASTSQVTTHDITLMVPAAITAGDTVTVAAAGVVNPGAGATSSTVATTQDTAPVSGAYTISAATAVTAVAAAPLPLTVGGSSTYTVGFTATTALVLGSGTITIASPSTTFPAVAGSTYTVKDGAGAATAVSVGTVGANTVTITTPVTIGPASAVVVVVTGVTNPAAGAHTLNVSTSQDSTAVASNSYTLATSVGPTVTAVANPTTTLVAATYTVTFVATTALLTSDSIALVAPTGTSFPLTMANYTVTDSGGGPVTALINPTHVTSAADVLLRLPAGISAGHTVTLVATGVTNPAAGIDTLTAATTKDAAAITSGTYSITSVGGGGTGGTTPTVPATPVRISGSDRFGTAIAASLVEFPTAGTAGAVVLARADDYPDALVGAALAAAKNGPLLFANGGLLTPATQAEIQRVLPAGGTVYLLGGTAAIPATVATSLTGLGFVPVRYAGTDRFGTALAVADALNDPGTVLLATGINFPDALAAGPAAAHLHGVVLLTNGSSLTPAVTQYLAAHPGTVYAIGGPAVAADPSATALSGADRYATAAMVASTVFTATANVGVASGTAFPDALSGGAFQAHFGGPIVLTDPHILPTSTSAYLTATKSTIVTTNIFGGGSALSATVQTEVGTALGL